MERVDLENNPFCVFFGIILAVGGFRSRIAEGSTGCLGCVHFRMFCCLRSVR